MNCLKPLIDAGADLSARGWFGGPALHWGAINGHETVVKYLVNQGADPNLRDDRFHANAAGWANENGHAEIRDWLLDNGCKASIVDAAAFGRIDLVKKHLERDPSSVNINEGRTALHEAAGRGNVELARLLLENGADQSTEDEDGLAPLEWAKLKNQGAVARLLASEE
jgi:ankyrin repeat protein